MTDDTVRATDQSDVTSLPSVFSPLVMVYLGSDFSRVLGKHSPGLSLVLRWLASCMLFCLAAAGSASIANDLRP